MSGVQTVTDYYSSQWMRCWLPRSGSQCRSSTVEWCTSLMETRTSCIIIVCSGRIIPSSPQHDAQYQSIRYKIGISTNEQHTFSLSQVSDIELSHFLVLCSLNPQVCCLAFGFFKCKNLRKLKLFLDLICQ